MSDFNKEFLSWKTKNAQHGPMAMNRFVMSKFLEALNAVAPDRYIFKGGNLLWHYINTPRPTVDLDFATDVAVEAKQVLEDIQAIKVAGVTFKVLRHEEKRSDAKVGMAAQIEFETETMSKNRFGIDIVFAVPTHQTRIKMLNREIKAASMENIILDKVSAIQRFGGGNTRMKDFDDLYRIAQAGPVVRTEILKILAEERKMAVDIPAKASDRIETFWHSYINRREYRAGKDLPRDVNEVIDYVRKYLKDVTK